MTANGSKSESLALGESHHRRLRTPNLVLALTTHWARGLKTLSAIGLVPAKLEHTSPSSYESLFNANDSIVPICPFPCLNPCGDQHREGSGKNTL